MKVRTLASLSGPMGRKAVGEVFTVTAEQGRDLIDRRLAEEVPAEPAPVAAEEKPAKAAKLRKA